jgi:hypothetical protein
MKHAVKHIHFVDDIAMPTKRGRGRGEARA